MVKFRKYYLLKLFGWCRAPQKIGNFFAVAFTVKTRLVLASKLHVVKLFRFEVWLRNDVTRGTVFYCEYGGI